MNNQEEKTIYILLTRYTDFSSRLFQLLTRSSYTHASVGLDEKKFYSFVTKGFRIEKPLSYPTFRKKEIPCELYSMQISTSEYQSVRRALEAFTGNPEQYRYSWMGLLLCMINVSHHFRNRFFCSQFVAEMVACGGQSSLCLPDDFRFMRNTSLSFRGTVRELPSYFGVPVPAQAAHEQPPKLVFQ